MTRTTRPRPPRSARRTGRPPTRLFVAAATAVALVAPVTVLAQQASAAPVLLSAGKAATASSVSQGYVATNVTDGNQDTYWESANNALPQWVQVDLGAAATVTDVRLELPAAWGTRSQTLQVQGSTDGTSFSTLKASASYTFSQGSNAVAIDTTDASVRYVRVTVSANNGWPAGQVSELKVYGEGTTTPPPSGTNLAQGRPISASSVQQTYVAANAVDGSTATYWEGAPGAYPSSLTVQLGSTAALTGVVVKLNPAAAWATRTQTFSIEGRTGTGAFATVKPSAAYTFDPASGNTVTIPLTASASDVRLTFTANSGSSNAQVAELQVIGTAGSTPTPTPTTDPTTPPPDPTGTNYARGRAAEASSTEWTYVAGNATDGDTATYWEGAGGQYPSTLTVPLPTPVQLSSVVVRLKPSSAWGTRTQTFAVLGRSGTGAFTQLKASAGYTFSPSSGNTVTIPVSGTATDVRLQFTGNTGSGNGQVAELEVYGAPAPNPDLTVTGVTASPASPLESDAITLSATVKNAGTVASPASSVDLLLAGAKVGSAAVGALQPGASTTVTASVGAKAAGSYALGATIDPSNAVVEQSETNNTLTAAGPLVVREVPSSDLVPVVAWSPSTPSAGQAVTFTAQLRNTGNVATSSSPHAVTVTVKNGSGTTVATLNGTVTGVIAAGATSSTVQLGSWTAANGTYTVTAVAAADSTEIAGRQGNNTVASSLFVGRGANMPYDMYEAEDGTSGGGAVPRGPNRTVGDLGGEASGRRAVTLGTTGSYVQWTTRQATNTIVARFSIPDGTAGSIDVLANGAFVKRLNLTSRFAWLYGDETSPQNSGSNPRHIYDEANMLLGTTLPAGTVLRLEKTSANPQPVTVDFVSTELATAKPNPDPARYVVPAGFTHQDVQAALDAARQDSSKAGVYLPAGDYTTTGKFQVYGRAIQVVGAGPWFTRFYAPQTQDNTDVGFRPDATANGTTWKDFAYFGNYVIRQDGPGKVFDFSNVANMTIDNVWVEHFVCMFWASNMDSSTITNSRIRNTFADGINMTNGSANNRVANIETRSTGDDAFALFAATDNGGTGQTGNVYENLTALTTWRAAGLAVYGGYGNTFRNIRIADTLVYSGITVSSLDFGYPMDEFGSASPTTIENVTLERTGGHFWGNQTFPGIWIFSASKKFQGIRITNVDIIDPTYSGIMFQTNYTSPTSPQNPITDTVFTNVTISGARKSGDAWDAKSGFGIWVNEMPEANQGPAVGSATFRNLTLRDNAQDIRNTTSTFTIVRE